MVDQQALAALRESKFGRLTVGQLMEKDVQFGFKDQKAGILANLMMQGFGSVPIVDQVNRLIGIVSEFDLLKAVRKGRNLNEVNAGDVMTPQPISLTQDTNVLTAIDVLQNNHLIRAPVVDASGKLVGIIARSDILRGYLQSISS